MINKIPLQTPVITYPEKHSPWEERFEAWAVTFGGRWVGQNPDVRGDVGGERVTYVELFGKFFGLKALEREERGEALLETLLEMRGGSEATLRGNP